MPEAFYVPFGGRYLSTELTRGPWDPGSQHGGPPAALLGRAIQRCQARDDFQVARITVEILRPVPIAPLTVAARLARPGRSVDLVEATMQAGDVEVMRARAWRIRTARLDLPVEAAPSPPPGVDEGRKVPFFDTGQDVGYHTAMETRFVHGAFREAGPALVWMRMRVPLVAGEEPSPLTRVLVAADSGNGVSGELDPRRYLFVNTDLTVHLHRLPAGRWVCLDATTRVEPHGVGMADARLWDEEGPLGRSLQSLYVAPRPG
jgi:hypothetical protein